MNRVDVLVKDGITADEVEEILRVAYADNKERRRLKELVKSSKGTVKKILSLFCLWFRPDQEGAVAEAAKLKDEDEAFLYLYLRLATFMEHLDEASSVMKKVSLSKLKFPLPFSILFADLHLRLGNNAKCASMLQKAEKLLEKIEGGERREWYEAQITYLKGCYHEAEGDWMKAIDCYGKAVSLAPDMHRAHFRLGYLCDLHGDEETAIKHYEAAKRIRPFHINTLINLGVLYEDAGRYKLAMECYKTVLEIEPTHQRAKFYLRDAEESLKMYYDEEKEIERERLKKLLATPVSDFELSVRSRNCKMNIKTLGDLVQRKESELLAYKNFGETSLSEIKQLLASKGLRLGLDLDELLQQVTAGAQFLTPLAAGEDDENVLALPVSKLQLSVRARRCLELLHIETLGELVQKTPQELMSVRNFGQTSLAEVKEQLAKFGLTLREEI